MIPGGIGENYWDKNPADIYLFKLSNRTRCEIKLIIKTPEWRDSHRYSFFTVNFEQISHFVLVLNWIEILYLTKYFIEILYLKYFIEILYLFSVVVLPRDLIPRFFTRAQFSRKKVSIKRDGIKIWCHCVLFLIFILFPQCFLSIVPETIRLDLVYSS